MAKESPSYEDILAAQARIASVAMRTPLVTNDELNKATGAYVFCKAENLQRVGAFKFRGAYNRLAQIPEAERKAGVVACSSGNHAQGVAEAARLLDMPATIVMPADSPELKLMRTERSGARVVRYDRTTENREEIAKSISQDTGAVFVHPYDDPGVIAGQGTLGVEMVEQAAAFNAKLDVVLSPVSGGGMASGVALALQTLAPECESVVVEPEGFDDYSRSLREGRRLTNDSLAGSICDALMAISPGEIGFEILKSRSARGVLVSDEDVLKAVAFAFHELKLVLEPGGAIALAALLSGKIDVAGRNVGIVLSGGNIDPAMMERALAM